MRAQFSVSVRPEGFVRLQCRVPNGGAVRLKFSTLLVTAGFIVTSPKAALGEIKISIETPMAPPTWALLERELIKPVFSI